MNKATLHRQIYVYGLSICYLPLVTIYEDDEKNQYIILEIISTFTTL